MSEENNLYAPFAKYSNYLSIVPRSLQKEWQDYYGLEFCLEHIGEARLYEMSLDQPAKSRKRLIGAWLKNAKDSERGHKASGGALLIIAEEMKRKAKEEKTILENMGSC